MLAQAVDAVYAVLSMVSAKGAPEMEVARRD